MKLALFGLDFSILNCIIGNEVKSSTQLGATPGGAYSRHRFSMSEPCCPRHLLPALFPTPKLPHLVSRFLSPFGFSLVIDDLLPMQASPVVPQSKGDSSHRNGDNKLYPHVSASNRFALIWRPIEQRGAEERLDSQKPMSGTTVSKIQLE